MLKRYLLFRDIVSDETLSEEKITRLREVFLETLKAFLKEEKAIRCGLAEYLGLLGHGQL